MQSESVVIAEFYIKTVSGSQTQIGSIYIYICISTCHTISNRSRLETTNDYQCNNPSSLIFYVSDSIDFSFWASSSTHTHTLAPCFLPSLLFNSSRRSTSLTYKTSHEAWFGDSQTKQVSFSQRKRYVKCPPKGRCKNLSYSSSSSTSPNSNMPARSRFASATASLSSLTTDGYDRI